jgi:hypothetical protein
MTPDIWKQREEEQTQAAWDGFIADIKGKQKLPRALDRVQRIYGLHIRMKIELRIEEELRKEEGK